MRYLFIAALTLCMTGCLQGEFGGVVDSKYVTGNWIGQQSLYIQVKTDDGDYKTAKVDYRTWREAEIGQHIHFDDHPSMVRFVYVFWGVIAAIVIIALLATLF